VEALYRRADQKNFELVFCSDINRNVDSFARLLAAPSDYESRIPNVERHALGVAIEGKPIHFIADGSSEALSGEKVDFVIDCTNAHTKRAEFEAYLPRATDDPANRARIVLPNFSREVDANLIFGTNEDTFDPIAHFLVGIGSCSMNATVPILAIIKELGLRSLILNVLHCTDGDEKVVDTPSANDPLTRAAGDSFFTTASRSLGNIAAFFPELSGQIHADNTRIPTAIGMRVVATLELTHGNADSVRALLSRRQEEIKGLIELIGAGEEHSRIGWGRPESAFVNLDGIRTVGGQTQISLWQDPHVGFSQRIWDMIMYMSNRIGI
jgi:glyceraldehyde 3-phosphate dehydrogenase